MGVSNILLWVLFLLVLPALSGRAVCRLLKLPPDLPRCYLAGHFFTWAFFQLVSVPLTVFRLGFPPLVISCAAVTGLLSLAGIYDIYRYGLFRPRRSPEKRNYADYFALVLMVAGFLAVAVAVALLQYENSDDWQFVAMSVDIDTTDQLFLTFHATGEPVTGLISSAPLDFKRFVVSPWSAWAAYIARVTGTHAAIVTHTVLPQALLLGVLSVYWLIADAYFPRSLFARCSFVFIAFLVNVFSGYCWYTAENFILRRPWQGKAAVAGLVIPAMYLSFVHIDRQPEGWRPYLALYGLCLSGVLMSSMGIILCAALSGAAGLVFGIAKRRITVSFKVWIGALLCLAYYGIYLLKW